MPFTFHPYGSGDEHRDPGFANQSSASWYGNRQRRWSPSHHSRRRCAKPPYGDGLARPFRLRTLCARGRRLKSAVSSWLNHERDITLAIRAAIPDFVRDTIRSNPPFQLVRTALHQRRGPIAGQCWFHEFRLTSYRLAAAASRPWRDGSSRTHGRSRCSRERYQPNHRSDAPLQLERTIR